MLMLGINRCDYFLCPPQSSKKRSLLINFIVVIVIGNDIYSVINDLSLVTGINPLPIVVIGDLSLETYVDTCYQ